MYEGTFKILYGDPNVGKKSLTPRFLTNLFVSDQTIAIGVDFEVKSLALSKSIRRRTTPKTIYFQ